MSIRDKILDYMNEESYKPLSINELMKAFNIQKSEKQQIEKILRDLEKDGKIVKNSKGLYGLPHHMGMVAGKIQGNEKGFGFLIREDGENDIFISSSNMNGAMDGDKVFVKLIGEGQEGKRQEGEVIRILKRAVTRVIGRFEHNNSYGFVVPDDRKMYYDVFIPRDAFNGAKHGYKVVAEITRYPEPRRNPEGRIVKVLGDENDIDTEIMAIIMMYDIEVEFPERVIKQAEAIEDNIKDEDIAGRLDLRDEKIVTIDGEDAKDFDDAVSIKRLDNGNYLLGVHIADVSHYVKEKSAIDKEARKRGTSIYIPGRVIPMLPFKLSNGLCSLKPGEVRLTLSCIMEIDNKGNVVKYDIKESVIKSKERMTYTQVYKILEEEDKDLMTRYDYLVDDFKLMKELALILNRKRLKRGSIEFEIPETQVILDENGCPVDIKKRERNIAHRIIEEFMLVCNETIAEHVFWLRFPFIYRIHENPDIEKLMDFNRFIRNFGLGLKGLASGEIHPRALQELLNKVKDTPEELVISTLLLRSLKQARYSNEHAPHFALAVNYYTHFTSPIRRYPDLEVHRIIKDIINGRMDEKRVRFYEKVLEKIAKVSSEMERVAQSVERDCDDLEKAVYMKDKIGMTFDGVISGVTNFGFFVELQNTVEGLVTLSSLKDDYYHYMDDQHILVGEHTRRIFKIGDKVKVTVSAVNVPRRQIDFVLEDQ
ncbi:ribonuclease R [Calorimonas adulescens]|jgi:RNAse R (EC 3.1.-.-)|uniref:Ribonuclease R n=1 Tax=Calorimonas adulescens TaxID=2606906 RepID=A0A5D8Q8X3_9THEO|nr:ribonuclease R [Calorimonas adulescens]TZE81225.1 ribonuclease R [Calorimonas adulescens]